MKKQPDSVLKTERGGRGVLGGAHTEGGTITREKNKQRKVPGASETSDLGDRHLSGKRDFERTAR